MPWELEWRMWRQLKGAFTLQPADMRFIFVPTMHKAEGYTFDQAKDIPEALDMAGDGARVFLEPTGYNSLHDLEPSDHMIYVLGNTQQGNIQHAQVNETYQIYTPGKADLYGINAAAIALAIGYGQ
jgi:hypothetical protein